MKLKITVQGVAYEVEVEVLDPGEGFAPTSALPSVRPSAPGGAPSSPAAPPGAASGGPAAAPRPSGSAPSAPGGGQIASPIGGTVVALECGPGDAVSEGQAVIILEAMKMNTTIAAPTAGRIARINVSVGDVVTQGQILAEFE